MCSAKPDISNKTDSPNFKSAMFVKTIIKINPISIDHKYPNMIIHSKKNEKYG